MAVSGRYFPVQTVHLGSAGTIAGFNESSLAHPGQLGMVIEDSGKVYRLVKFDNGDAVASAAGGAAHWKTRADYVVTSDQTDAEAALGSIAGGFLGVVTDGNYCFVQIGGLQTIITDGNATKGSAVIATATDLAFGNMADGATEWASMFYGVHWVTDSGTVGSMYWMLGQLL